MNKKTTKATIYAYGFDKCGFSIPFPSWENSNYILKFTAYDSDYSFEEADGLVIPSGIFEEIYWERDFLGENSLAVRFDKALLASREKQLYNAFKKGVWTAFLLGAVNTGEHNDWIGTDLAKKFLNIFAERISVSDPNPYVTCKAGEFAEYLDRFGVAQTEFRLKDKASARLLAHAAETPVALEVNGQFFFLPFFTTKKDRPELTATLKLIVESVLEYKRKNDIYLPAWLNKMEFTSESKIKAQIQKTEEQLVKLNEEVAKWEKYKTILCTSGSNLNAIVVEVLRDFFGLNLKSEEKYIEDAVIYSTADEPIFVVEIKGVNGGIKREHVNQVDSHRERLGLREDVSGLLIINDFMDIESFEERRAKMFDAQHLIRAETNNVKVLRTTSLFEMMVAWEDTTDRQGPFLAACKAAAPLVRMT